MADKVADSITKIGFPVKCDYKGGIQALGKHGKHFWIQDGNLGHGELSLTHGVPLSSVSGVEVFERATKGRAAQPMLAQGVHGARQSPAVKPRQFTEVNVRMQDGQVGLWVVDRHGGDWVRKRIAPALHKAGVSLN